MKIVGIFADQLTSFHYDGEQLDEFTRLFRLWQDPLYLYNFFTENIDDLQDGFFGTLSITTAIRETRLEARRLEQLFMTQSAGANNLDSIFSPLTQNEPLELTKSKARGDSPKSWLRIYAIKVDANAYIITGGVIKLTRSMQDRNHTAAELTKFKRCLDFLKEEGITDVDGVHELLA